MKDTIKHDLPMVGAIYVLIIVLCLYFKTDYHLISQTEKTRDVKRVAVDIHDELKEKQKEIDNLKLLAYNLKIEVKKHEDVKRLVKELDRSWGNERR